MIGDAASTNANRSASVVYVAAAAFVAFAAPALMNVLADPATSAEWAAVVVDSRILAADDGRSITALVH